MDDVTYDDFGNPLYPVNPVDSSGGDGIDMTGGSAGNTDTSNDNIDVGGGWNPAQGPDNSKSGGNWWDSIIGGATTKGGIGQGIRSTVGKALGMGGDNANGQGSSGGLLDNVGPLLLAGGAGMLLGNLFSSKGGGASQVQPVSFPTSNLSPTQLVQATSNPGNIIGTPVAPVQPTNLGQLITPQQVNLLSPVAPTTLGR